AGLVDVVDQDAGRKALRRGLVDIPAHIEPALRLLLEILQRRRLDRIDRDALPGRDDADDAVDRPPAAARRELDRQIGIDAADRDRRAAADGIGGRFDREALLAGKPPEALFLVVGIH